MIRAYQDLPDGQRRTLVSVIRAVSSALRGGNATPEWRGVGESIPGLSD